MRGFVPVHRIYAEHWIRAASLLARQDTSRTGAGLANFRPASVRCGCGSRDYRENVVELWQKRWGGGIGCPAVALRPGLSH